GTGGTQFGDRTGDSHMHNLARRLVWCNIASMPKDDGGEQIAARYRRFAEVEARGHSPLYEAFALGVAGDPFALQFLADLPDENRQPNLLFAALRHRCGRPADWPAFLLLLQEHADAVRTTMLTHRTQTNEPARCAVLLPVLVQLPQPLA